MTDAGLPTPPLPEVTPASTLEHHGGDRARGHLTVYLGAAPGVGKTYAMLDEAARRVARGTDVVVGLVETHGRAGTEAKIGDLEVLPRASWDYRGLTVQELDVDGVIERRPDVVLIDELAHTNPPGATRGKRWQDVHAVLDAGIDVVTTVNIQHVASLVDDVAAITGVTQRETVPDQVVRDADTIQLVDLSPHQLRRRLAHGNIYRADQVDASLSRYFREGNLTALRELALLWLADRVDDALTRYRTDNAIEASWPARERIVVAVTGGPESDAVIRRAARIAQRAAGSELMAVHVLPTDGLPSAPPGEIASHRLLTESLEGTFHTVVGEDIPHAIVDFAAGANATMIVVGVSRHSPWRRALKGSVGDAIAKAAGSIDVHLVTHDHVGGTSRAPSRYSSMSLPRRLSGWVMAVLAPALVAAGVAATPLGTERLPTALALQFGVVVGVALLGGLGPALAAAILSFLALNWFNTEPHGKFLIDQPGDVLALIMFCVVAIAVATVVDLAARRTAQAYRAQAEASALASLSSSLLGGDDAADAIVTQLQSVFNLTHVKVDERLHPHGPWTAIAHAGDEPARLRAGTEHETRVSIDDSHRLVLTGPPLPATDRQIIEAFASQIGIVLEHRRLRNEAAEHEQREASQQVSTALLAAVSHDLRTPLSTIRASIDGLQAPELDMPETDRAGLTQAIDHSTTRLERLIGNLLDLSRIHTGAVVPAIHSVSLDEVVPLAVEPWIHAVTLDLDEDLPWVSTDSGLLERVLDNLVSNAIRHTPRGTEVRVSACAVETDMEIRVTDRGPGVDPKKRAVMFEPFRRGASHADGGIGLGLAVASGLAQAIGAHVHAEDTPGGGLTMVVTVPLAPVDAPS